MTMNKIKSLFSYLSILMISLPINTIGESTEKPLAEIRPDLHSWSAKVSAAAEKVVLDVDGCTFTFIGDSADPGQIRISISGREESLIYRYWPDISKWQLLKEGQAIYSREFKDIPGWKEHLLHLRVTSHQTSRQLWLDDRLLREWQVNEKGVPRIVLNGNLEWDVSIQGEHQNHIQIIPLEHYFNDEGKKILQPDATIELDGMAKFLFASYAGTAQNLDLGQLVYREEHLKPGPFQRLSLPYINCDAFSSDPKRAIFRLPLRFYDRLHLLCYSDNDEGEVPRAAFRFIKPERARFVDREFGLVSEENAHILEIFKIGENEVVHLAVDLNPSAWQEFLTQPPNEYLEFELTRPLVMDNNSFIRPDGPPSSLHILALALEEAPVNMVVMSDVAGHLFDTRDTAIMKVQLKSNAKEEQTGSIKISITKPDGQIRREDLKFRLPPYGEKIIPVDLNDVPVGKSTFSVHLSVINVSGREHVMERHTSFAILPKFT